MTASEDEKKDKASSFVDQTKSSNRSRLNVSEKTASKASIAQTKRASANVIQITDKKSAKKARLSNLSDQKTHAASAPLHTSDNAATTGKKRGRDSTNSQRKATMLKPSAKNSSTNKARKTLSEQSSDKFRSTDSIEVEFDAGGGLCCEKSSSRNDRKYQPVENDEKCRVCADEDAVSGKSRTEVETCTSTKPSTGEKSSKVVSPCTQCQGTDSRPTVSSTPSQISHPTEAVPSCPGSQGTDSDPQTQASDVKVEPTTATSAPSKSESFKTPASQVSDDVELTEAAPPCVQCQGSDLKPTATASQNQTSSEPPRSGSVDTKSCKIPGCLSNRDALSSATTRTPSSSEIPEQQSSGIGVQPGKPCEVEIKDCHERIPAPPEIKSEISEGTVLASSETEKLELVSVAGSKPPEVDSVEKQSSKPTKARAQVQTVKAARARSRSQRSSATKIPHRDRTPSENAKKVSKKNCTLMNWNPFKKITKALSISSKSSGSSCDCELQNQKEAESAVPAMSVSQGISTTKPSSSDGCPPCRPSSKTSLNATATFNKPTFKSSCAPCGRVDNTTASSTQSKLKSFATKETCRMCQQEAIYKKAQLAMSKSKSADKKLDLQGKNERCPVVIPKCLEQTPLSTSKPDTTCMPKTEPKQESTQGTSDKSIPQTSQKCQPLPQCGSKDKPVPPSKIDMKNEPAEGSMDKSSLPISSCQIRCASGKPVSTSSLKTEPDKLVEDSTKGTIPSSPSSSCRIYCPSQKPVSVSAVKVEKSDEPSQESTGASIPPSSSPEPKCSIHSTPAAASSRGTSGSTSTQKTVEESGEYNLTKKPTSPASQKGQNVYKCPTHDTSCTPLSPKSETEQALKQKSDPSTLTHDATDKPVCASLKNETKSTEKDVPSSSPPKGTEQDSTQKSAPPSSSVPKCWMKNIPYKPASTSSEIEKLGKRNDSVEKFSPSTPQKSPCVPKCVKHSSTDESVSIPLVDKPISNDNQDMTEKSSPTASPSPVQCGLDRPHSVSSIDKPEQAETIQDTMKKPTPSILEECQAIPKCGRHSKMDEPHSNDDKKMTDKFSETSPSPKCWTQGRVDKSASVSSVEPISTISKTGAVPDSTQKPDASMLQKSQPVPKCRNSIATDESTLDNKNTVQVNMIEESVPPSTSFPKCWTNSAPNKPESVFTRHEPSDSTPPKTGVSQDSTHQSDPTCLPLQCRIPDTKNESVSPSPKSQKCKAVDGLSEKPFSPQKYQPLPKCSVHESTEKDRPVSTSSTDGPISTSLTSNKCKAIDGLSEKPFSRQEYKPLPKCAVHESILKGETVLSSSADKPISTLPKSQKKCETTQGSEKNVQSQLQKCQPLPKCWIYGTKDKSVSTSSEDKPSSTLPGAPKKCDKVKGLPEKYVQPTLPSNKCQPLPKCWMYKGAKDRPVSISSAGKSTSTKGRPASTSSEDKQSSISPKKCQPLPKCWEQGRADDPVLKLDTPGSPATQKCKTQNSVKSEAPSSLQKTKNQCQPLPKCWVMEKQNSVAASLSTPNVCSSKTPVPASTLPIKTQSSSYSIDDICAKTTPTVSSQSSNTSASSGTQKDSCMKSCSKKVSADGSNSAQPASTLSPISDSRKPSNACSCTCLQKESSTSIPETSGAAVGKTVSTSSPFCRNNKFSSSTDGSAPAQHQIQVPSSSSQTTKDAPAGGVCPQYCQRQSSKQPSTSTSLPQNLHPSSSNTSDGISNQKHSSAESSASSKCMHTGTTLSPKSSAESMTKSKSTNDQNSTLGPASAGTCGKPCKLSSAHEQTISPHAEKPSETSNGGKRSITETTSSGSQYTWPSCSSMRRSSNTTDAVSTLSHTAGSVNKESASTSSAKSCAPCSGQNQSMQHDTLSSNTTGSVNKVTASTSSANVCVPCLGQNQSIQHDTPNSKASTTSTSSKYITTAAPTTHKSDSTSSTNLCLPACSTQFHKGKHQYQNMNSTTPTSIPARSDEHIDGSSTTSSNVHQKYESQNQPDKPVSTSLPTVSESGAHSEPGSTSQDLKSVSSTGATSSECKECLRLRATPAPKCEECTKKSVSATSTAGAHSVVNQDVKEVPCTPCKEGYRAQPSVNQTTVDDSKQPPEMCSNASCKTSSSPNEVNSNQQAISDMINEGPVVHPDSVKTTDKDSSTEPPPFIDCMFTTDEKTEPVESEPGPCCRPGGMVDKNGCPHSQCSIPTTTAAPKKGSESSGGSAMYTSTSYPPDYNSVSDEKFGRSDAVDSQPRKQSRKKTSHSSRGGGGLERKRPLKPAPRGLRKRTIADAATGQQPLRESKKRAVPKRVGLRKALDQSEQEMLYRSNRSARFRQKTKKTTCGRRRYSSTDSEERTVRGRITYRTRPQIPVTLTHAVHLRRRHTDQSRERMLAAINKKKKHDTRFQ